MSFDFYDDWDEDDGFAGGGRAGGGGILGWGNDELDRLLAGSGSGHGHGDAEAPKRKRGMSYGGTRAGRRKSLEADPTVIPSTNSLGFLGRLPFKFGGTLRYKPSAADLQDHPGQSSRVGRGLGDGGDGEDGEEGEPLIESEDEEHSEGEGERRRGHRRNRSGTASSGETSDSFRSRGDIFPSDGEDDAVPLDDEFAMVLERRMTGEANTGKAKSHKGKRPVGSRTLSRTMSRTTHSSRTRPTLDGHRSSSAASLPVFSDPATPDMAEAPSFSDLLHEEEAVRMEEDEEIERKRQAAARLAVERGLSVEPEERIAEAKDPVLEEEEEYPVEEAESEYGETSQVLEMAPPESLKKKESSGGPPNDGFNPANLPSFG